MSRLQSTFLGLLLFVGSWTMTAADDGWPRTLAVDDGTLTIYKLQPEALTDDNIVRYRGALAWRRVPSEEPVFGAGWFESSVTINDEARLVQPRDLRLVRTRFPEDTAGELPDLQTAVAAQSTQWALDFSLDALEAGLKAAEAEKLAAADINTARPRSSTVTDRPC